MSEENNDNDIFSWMFNKNWKNDEEMKELFNFPLYRFIRLVVAEPENKVYKACLAESIKSLIEDMDKRFGAVETMVIRQILLDASNSFKEEIVGKEIFMLSNIMNYVFAQVALRKLRELGSKEKEND